MTNLFIKKEEFRWSFQKKGKHVLNICTRLLFMAGVTALIAGSPTAAQANPTGGTVVGGAATITNTPAELQINQSSQNAVIDWSSFNIAKGETTHFYQPNTSAIALNRVVNSTQISTINGNLLANGHVLVINPNGVLIGPSGNVDTAGFIATSADIANDAFMNGNGKLDFNIAGSANASVVNQGKITVEGEGLAALVAPTVRNDGIIQGTLSKIQLGAADTFGVDLYGDGLLSLAVGNGTASRTISAENAGSIIASGGKVLMTAAAANDVVDSVINNTGDIQAQSLVDHNGEITLTAPGANVAVSGTLDVSGANGGGTIKVGGDTQGGGTLAHASTVNIASGAVLNARATDNGNGGNVVVWSDNGTSFHGTALATGGANGGNGGTVETSSPVNLQVSGSSVDTLAPKGAAGDWLLDPNSVSIVMPNATGSNINSSNINVLDINNAKTNVTIQADNKITFNADVNMGYAGVGLTAKAGKAGSSWDDLAAGAGTITLSNHYVRTYGGYVMFESGNTISVNNATIYTRGGAFSLTGGDVNVNNTDIATGGGTATFTSIYKANSEAHDCGDHNSDDNGTDGQISIQKMTLNTSGGTGSGGISITNNGFTWGGTPTQLADNFGNNNTFETSNDAGHVSISSQAIRESNNNCISAGGTSCLVSDPVPLTTLTLTADNQTKTYGQTFTFGGNDYTVTGTTAQGDSLTGATLASAGAVDTANVSGSPYTIYISNATGNLGFGNYKFVYVNGTMTVDPASLTYTANAVTTAYGTAATGLSGTVTGFVLGQTEASATTGTLQWTTPATASSNVGQYAINGSGLFADNGNYTFVQATGNATALTIGQAMLTVTADNASMTYGSRTLPSLTDTISGFVNGDTAGSVSGSAELTTTATTYNGTAGSGSHVGSYAIDAALGTLSAQNYGFRFVNGKLTVTPAALTIAANNASMTYGGAGPVLTDTITGLQNGDTSANLTTQPVLSSGTAYTSNAGTYANTLTASGAADPDYTISYVPGTLTINPATVVNFASDVYGMNIEFGPLARPIISVADKTINYDPPFEPSPTQSGDIHLSIGGGSGSGISLAQDMANITPAAGGNVNPADLANITPAAGGNVTHRAANNNEFACAADFLEGGNCYSRKNVQ